MARSKRERIPKTVLKLPDLEQSKSAASNSLTSATVSPGRGDWTPDTAELRRRVLEGNPRILRITGMDFWRVEIDWSPASML